MIEITANTILLSIEGTIAPYSFLHDVLFPYAVANARSYLSRCWDQVETLNACDQMARDAGFASSYDWLRVGEVKLEDMIERVVAEVEKLSKENSRTGGLKELQSSIWAEAYASGRLLSQVFEDVPQALACWKAARIPTAVYSATIATSQREFLGHTEYGSLIDYIAGFFDTANGPKTEPASYRRIAGRLSAGEPEMVFMSDLVVELDAARCAGMQTLLLLRPGNAVQEVSTHPTAESLYDVRILRPAGLPEGLAPGS